MCIMKKLDCFWKHTNNPIKWKLITYNAIIKTKLMYGLESAQLNDSIKKYLDTFHLKCLRKILNLEHTYLDRENTNKHVYETAEREMNKHNLGKHKELIKLSEYYEAQRIQTISQIIHHKDEEDTRVSITFNRDTLHITEYSTKRIGRPKFAWWIFALDNLWLEYRKTSEAHRYTPLNLDKLEHLEIVKQTAKENYEAQQKKKKKHTLSDPHAPTTVTPTESTPRNTDNNANANAPNTNFVYSHTISNDAKRLQSTEQQPIIYEFPEFDEPVNNKTDTFKRTLHLHNARDRLITNAQLKVKRETFKQQLSKHVTYNNIIINTHFHKHAAISAFKQTLSKHSKSNKIIVKAHFK